MQYFHTPEHFTFLRETFLHCQFNTTHCSQFNSKSILPFLCFSGIFIFFLFFLEGEHNIPSAALPLIANCIFLFVLFLVRNIVRMAPHGWGHQQKKCYVRTVSIQWIKETIYFSEGGESSCGGQIG